MSITRTFSNLFSDKSLTKKASLNAFASVLDYGTRWLVTFMINPLLVTGLGAITPLGLDMPSTWSGLVRGALARKYDVETALLLTGRYPSNAPAILDGLQRSSIAEPGLHSPGAAVPPITNAVPERLAAKLPAGLEWLSATARRGNSNNWVLAARRTRSGNPMLANDPHLQIEFPSVWYEMHLVAADLDVAGVTIPGVPFVAIGHNARIAWGITNTNADVQDLALERIDVSGKRAFYRGEWVSVDVEQTEIPVRGRAQALPFEIWKTRNGAIVAVAITLMAPVRTPVMIVGAASGSSTRHTVPEAGPSVRSSTTFRTAT